MIDVPTKRPTHNRRSLTITITLLIAMSVLAVPVVAASPTISASGGTTSPGETITVSVTVEQAQTVEIEKIPSAWTIKSKETAGAFFNKQETSVGWVWGSDQSSKTVTVTFNIPSDAATGDTILDVIAEDSDGNKKSTTTTVTIESENTPPVADAGEDQSIEEDKTVTLDGSGSTDPDPDDSLTYEWVQTSGPSVSLQDANTATPEFTAPEVDSDTPLTFELTVRDESDATSNDTVQITVTDVKNLETAVSLQPTNREVQSGETITYDIVVESANNGVGAFDDVNVTVNDTDVATIKDISTDVGSYSTFISDDESEASIDLPFGGDTSDTGEVTIATVELQTHTGGTAQLDLDVTGHISNEQGILYSLTSKNGATLAVSGDTDENPAVEIVIDDQSYEESTDTVSVANATWTGTGSFAVAIHDSSAGSPGPIIGWSESISAGTKTDLTIDLDQNITSNVTATAMVHESINGPAITRGGSPVSDTAKITITPDSTTTLPPLPGDDDDPETAVTLQPTNKRVTTGNSVRYDVVVESISNGIETYEFNISISDTTNAKITDVSLVGDQLGFIDNVVWGRNNGSLSAVSIEGDHNNGVIASVTVTGENPGTATLSLSDVTASNNNFTSYEITSVDDATVTVESVSNGGVIAELTPDPVSASASSTTTVDVHLENTDNGVRSYEFTATVTDTNIATITDVSLTGTTKDASGTSVNIAPDGSQIDVGVAAGSINNNVIATIELATHETGSAELELSDVVVGDVDFSSYVISETNPATIEVGGSVTPEIISGSPAQNANSDPQLEDVNGDGSFNIIDVGALLLHRNSPAVQNNIDLFDFNGDGAVNIIDVGKLLIEATA